MTQSNGTMAFLYGPIIQIGNNPWMVTTLRSQLSTSEVSTGARRRQLARSPFEGESISTPVILGVSLGALKGFGKHDGMVESLASASPNFRRMVEGIELVPSMSVQLWSNKTAENLGYFAQASAAVSGPEPLDINANIVT